MEKDVLEIHFVREGNVIDKNANSMQKLMWNMGTVMAQSYTDQLSKVISLAARSYDLFQSSNTDEKRAMLGFVFSNLELEGATLRFTLRKPFEQFSKIATTPEWRAGQDKSGYWEINLLIA